MPAASRSMRSMSAARSAHVPENRRSHFASAARSNARTALWSSCMYSRAESHSRSRTTKSGCNGRTSSRRCFEYEASKVTVGTSAARSNDAGVRLASSLARRPVSPGALHEFELILLEPAVRKKPRQAERLRQSISRSRRREHGSTSGVAGTYRLR